MDAAGLKPGLPSYCYSHTEPQLVTFPRLLVRIFLRLRFPLTTSYGKLVPRAVQDGSYPAFYPARPTFYPRTSGCMSCAARPLLSWGYVKGIETVWLEIGNEKVGHIFQGP